MSGFIGVRENRTISSDQENQNFVSTEERYIVLDDKEIPIGTKESAKDGDNKNLSCCKVNSNRSRCKKNQNPSIPLFSKKSSSIKRLQVANRYNSIQNRTIHLKHICMTLVHFAEKVHTIAAVDKNTSNGIETLQPFYWFMAEVQSDSKCESCTYMEELYYKFSGIAYEADISIEYLQTLKATIKDTINSGQVYEPKVSGSTQAGDQVQGSPR
uniref:Uncharacterized protein n=1 Tax=Ascaris lumbricoides TaxID=6252 RepID=A0A0M3I2F6_ASCLU